MPRERGPRRWYRPCQAVLRLGHALVRAIAMSRDVIAPLSGATVSMLIHTDYSWVPSHPINAYRILKPPRSRPLPMCLRRWQAPPSQVRDSKNYMDDHQVVRIRLFRWQVTQLTGGRWASGVAHLDRRQCCLMITSLNLLMACLTVRRHTLKLHFLSALIPILHGTCLCHYDRSWREYLNL